MEIKWNPAKAAANLQKHGVTFEEATVCFYDPYAVVIEDTHAEAESRWVLMGIGGSVRLLTVVYTLRGEDTIRIISARKASRKERRLYA